MKRVVSVSLGSSQRDHRAEVRMLDQDFLIERKGTDGDLKKARHLLESLDGRVDAFGLGGIDLYIRVGERRYTLRDAKRLIAHVKETPVVDGSGLKDTLEKEIIKNLHQYQIDLSTAAVLLVCGVDRSGMAEAFHDLCPQTIYGDLIFALGLPIPIRKLKTLKRVSLILAPIICQLPFRFLYPTGTKQSQNGTFGTSYSHYYDQVRVVAGDFHYIKKNLPSDLTGKIIITNTVTGEDIEELRRRKAQLLITTTPDIGGRSFGTNVIEAMLVAYQGQGQEGLSPADYLRLITQLELKPRIINLNTPSINGGNKAERGAEDA